MALQQFIHITYFHRLALCHDFVGIHSQPLFQQPGSRSHSSSLSELDSMHLVLLEPISKKETWYQHLCHMHVSNGELDVIVWSS